MFLPFTLAFALFESAIALTPTKRYYLTHDYYVLEHRPGAGASVKECAKALGVELVEQAGELQNHWVVRTEKISPLGLLPREAAETDHILARLESLQTQVTTHRNSFFSPRSTETRQARRIISAIKYLSRQTPRKRTKRDDSFIKRAPPPAGTKGDAETSSRAIALRMGITDPMFGNQWHLVNDEFPQHMMNATPVWEMGLTGKGVITALVDDGLDYKSDDLAANFVRVPAEYFDSFTLVDIFIRTQLAPMTSTTTLTYPHLHYSMITTVHAAPGRLQQ
jgi:kexin